MNSGKSLVKQFKTLLGGHEACILRGNFFPLFLITDWLRFYDDHFRNRDEGVYPALSIKRNGIIAYYLDLYKYNNVTKIGIQRYLKSPNFMNNVEARYEKIKKELGSFYESYIFNNSSKENTLLESLRKAEEYLHEVVALTLFVDFLDYNVFEETYAASGLKINFKKVYETANIYDFETFDLKNNKEILKWINKNNVFLKYVYTGYSAAPSTEEVGRKLSKIDITLLRREVEQSTKNLNIKKQSKKKLYGTLDLEERKAADFLSWAAMKRDDRKILMNKMDVVLHDTISKLYEIWGLNPELAKNSFAFEVQKGRDYVLNNISRVQARANDFINLYYGGEKYVEKYTDLAQEFEEAMSLEKPRKEANIIEGQIANKGKVKGFVKVIHDPRKNHSFMEGEILVTSMTRPEFVPLMKKASAVVTNEGGISCHAAIVSRELNKPCIIGTKIATEILKDGDEVEVDANEGMVRIIKRTSK